MSDRVELAVEAIRRLSPHKNRYAKYSDKKGYTQIKNPVKDEQLELHVIGQDLIGGVSADDNGMTDCVGLDVDAHTSDQDALGAAKKFVEFCQALQVPTVVHTSKSGNGFHVRTLFSSPVTTWLARALYTAIAVGSGVDKDKAVDKVWPPSRGYGVLALPYQAYYARKNHGTLAVDTSSWTLIRKSEQIEAVTESEEVDPEDVEALLDFMGIKTERAAKIFAGCDPRSSGGRVTVKDSTDLGLEYMMRHCDAVARLEEEATEIGYDFWFGMMTNFRPFVNGKVAFEAYSQLDPSRYDQKGLDASWRGINGNPRLCENLETGWVCPSRKVCPAGAPAALPFYLKKMNLI